MKKIFTLSILLLLFAFAANAQWYKLKAYADPYTSDSSLFIGGGDYPVLPGVVGNGIILYGGEYSYKGLHTSGENIMYSKNDLQICNNVASEGGGIAPGNIYCIASKNDSTYCFIYVDEKGKVDITYTANSFITTSTIDTLNLPDVPVLMPTCFSPDFIYTVWQGLSNNDSIVVYRADMNPSSIREYFNFSYATPTNLAFTSDSIGYMICSYRNNSSKSVLARTADSGKTWTDNYLDSVNTITAFCFPSTNIGYMTKSNGNIYKTTNSGATWVKLISPITLPLRCVSFSDTLNGYIGGDKGALYSTTNGGLSWNTEISADPNSIISLYTFGKVAYFKDATDNLYKNESPMGIENIQANGLNVDVYPNPSNNGKFAVEITNYELGITSTVEVYNMLGEKISSPSLIHTSHFVIGLSSQPNGIYMYRLVSEKDEQLATGKLVIQK